jgi:glycosyltransferase involved in cell wall biosynthesis
VIAGDGANRPAFEALARDLRIQDRVHFLGWRRDVPELLPSLSVVVLPTTMDFEGTPLTVIEALAASRPVVATDVGGVAEVVRHGETGLLVPPRNEAALADALDAQLSDSAAAARMGQKGCELVRQLYQRSRMVDETEQLFRELLCAVENRRLA